MKFFEAKNTTTKENINTNKTADTQVEAKKQKRKSIYEKKKELIAKKILPKEDKEKKEPISDVPPTDIQNIEKENVFSKDIKDTEKENVFPKDIEDTDKENVFQKDIAQNAIEEKIETKPKFIYKRLVNKKLFVILVENTPEMAKEKAMIMKIIKSLAPSGLITVINYGKTVKPNEIFDAATVNERDFLCPEDIGDEACLYDALDRLEIVVSDAYMKIEEKETERVRIDKIDVIGIGNCKENGSKISKERALKYFKKVANMQDVTTKYFCLSENSFIEAAEIGFHSIGSIYRKYQ